MQSDGQTFLEQFASFPRATFEGRFLQIAIRLRLGSRLTAAEFRLLYEVALYASFCNIAFNGLGGCGGKILPEQEANRTGLELQFMGARHRFQASAGWRALEPWQRKGIQDNFLTVLVAECNLVD